MSIGSLRKIVDLIESTAVQYPQVKQFGSDFESEMQNYLTNNEKWFSVFVAIPQETVMTVKENVNTITVRVFCHGRIQNNRNNIIDIVSDSQLILSDLYRELNELNEDFELEGESNIVPVNNSLLDYLAGNYYELTFIVNPVNKCEIPKLEDYE